MTLFQYCSYRPVYRSMIHQHRCTFLPPLSTQCAGCKSFPDSSVAMPEDEIVSGSVKYTIILYFATHLQNKILYGPYLQFNGPTTLPSGARLLSTALPSAQSELQGKKQQGNDHVPLIWLLYHLLFSKKTSRNKSFISKLSPDISWLAWLCPH